MQRTLTVAALGLVLLAGVATLGANAGADSGGQVEPNASVGVFANDGVQDPQDLFAELGPKPLGPEQDPNGSVPAGDDGSRLVDNGSDDGDGDERAGLTNGSGRAGGLDSDADGLSDDRERDRGAAPFAPDTDGDGLRDGREVDLGTDPTVADTDGDGVPDGRELELGTDPAGADTDGDGLADAVELEVGTDPTDTDTDGDGLPDGWEYRNESPGGVPLPDSDPTEKDIYVRVDYAGDAEPNSEAFYDWITHQFEEMPVRNDEEGGGIDVHVRRGRALEESIAFTGGNFESIRKTYYDRLGRPADVYHQVLVAPFSTDDLGYGEVGGEFSVVAADAERDTRRQVVVHELLHNVVGRIDAPGACENDPHHYCDGGWLQPRITPGEGEYLPDPIATQLEREGFTEE